MKSDVQHLRRCVESAISALSVPFGAFCRTTGFSDFCLDAEAANWEPRILAAEALFQLTDGKTPRNDFAVCVAVTQFLDERYGVPRADKQSKQRVKDLVQLTTNPQTLTSVLEWIDTWYS